MKKIILCLLCGLSLPAWSFELMPEKVNFTPLMIDPAESRMSGTYGFYDMHPKDGLVFGRVGNVSIGGHVPLFNFGSESKGIWQIGLDAASKMQFLLDQQSLALAQADESFGIDLSWKKNKISTRLRTFHVSSHLGDEYIRITGQDRFQYNTEGFDMLMAYQVSDGFKVYGGGDYYFNIDPLNVGTNMAHFGAEYIHPTPLFSLTYLVMGADFKLFERNDYSPNTAAAIGLQFSNAFNDDRFMRIMLEGYTGSSPHTQFFTTDANYYGITFQFGF